MSTTLLPQTPPSRGHRVPWAPFASFVAWALFIVAANGSTIASAGFEIGDFAANSLLVLDAKSFHLLRGNYSRVGFNHPGPAILYVLALAEWMFHDVLRVVGSPFAAQLIGVALYNAAWIACIGRVLGRVVRRPPGALLGTLVFVAATELSDHDFLAGAWFPHLYYFPFATMLLAAAELARGRGASLPMLAVATAFLVNGHAAFVAIVAIVVVSAVVLNAAIHRAKTDVPWIASRSFLRMHRRAVAIAAAIVVLSLVPLAIETVRHFPGPVASYAGFGHGQQPHPLGESLRFVAGYWGGLVPVVAATATLSLLAVATAPADRPGYAALVGVFCAATVAVFLYARYGVDLLSYRYVAFFYFAVPALVVAATSIAAFAAAPDRASVPAAVLVAIACVAVSFVEARRPTLYGEQYDDPNLPALYRTLKAQAAGGRLVLDLDTRRDWDYLWTRVVGVEAYAKRRGDDLFCINRNWHIVFDRTSRCSADEMRLQRRYLVRAMRADEPRDRSPAFDADGLYFFAVALPDLSDAGTLPVASHADLFETMILQGGWGALEGDHAWSVAREAHLGVRLREGFRGFVDLDLGAFLPKPDSTVGVTIRVDGRAVGSHVFTAAAPQAVIPVAVGPLAATETADIALVVDNAVSPQAAGVGADPRALGVSIRGIAIRDR